MGIRSRSLVAILILTTVFGLCLPAGAASRNEVVNRMEDFRRFFVDFQGAPDMSIPGDLLAECHGVIIMRHYRAGFVIGVRGGDGVVLLRDPASGAWWGPAFVVSAEGSFGFQIGGQAIDAIMLIMNRDGIDMLMKSRFQVGVDASAAAGPVGRDASAKVGPGTAILAYSRAKGLYAGVAFEGGALLNYDDYNRAMYGRDITIKEILINPVVPVPPEAYALMETIQGYMTVKPAPQPLQPAPITLNAPASPAPAQPQPMPQVQPLPQPQLPPAAPVVPPPPAVAVQQPTPPLPTLPPQQAPAPAVDHAALDKAAADAAAAAKAAADAAARAQAAAAEAAAKAAAARQGK